MECRELYADLPTITTDRLILRKMNLTDVEDGFAIASDPEVCKYVEMESHRSLDDSRVFVRMMLDLYRDGTGGQWAVEHKQDRRMIGIFGYHSWSPVHRRAEVGYALGRAYWKQGLMSEILRSMLTFGFERMDLNRIEANCDADNLGAWRVMEKVGMKLEGTRRQYLLVKGQFRDFRLYSILREEW